MLSLKARLLTLFVLGVCGLASAQNHWLVRTYIDQGYYASGRTIPANQNTVIGPVVPIVCPGTSGMCTIQADHFIQEGKGMSMGNQFVIGFYLDGMPVTDAQIVGCTPSDGSYLVAATSERQSMVAPGMHTVQTFVWSMNGASVFNYNTNFRVYKP